MALSFSPVGGYVLVAAAALALVALLFLRPARRKTTTRQRRWLVLLRFLVVLLIVMALLRPTLVYTATRKQAATLIMLIDRSRSMMVTDAFGNQSRWSELRDVLEGARDELARLAEEVELKIYTFDADAQPLATSPAELTLENEATGEQTAIGAVVDDVLRREAGKRLAGLLLLSDGAQRAYSPRDLPPQVAARRLADLGCPLYTFAFGQAQALGEARDVALRDLLVSPTVFVKNELPVGGTARINGLSGEPIPVQLLFETASGEMVVVDSTRIVATAGRPQVPIELGHTPPQPGEYKLTLKAQRATGELVTANNELSTFVTVLPGGLKVLYLEGRYWWESKFLRRALDGSPQIQVDFLRMDAQDARTRPPDLEERLIAGPDAYDVFILGDLDSSAFKPEELGQLAETVKAGAGLIMLGGFHSFGPGGYQETALADVLPIKFGPKERQSFSQDIASDLHLSGLIPMRPTAMGERHFLMLLTGRESNQALWQKIPPLEGANRFRGRKPRAQVLAEGPNGEPLLVAHEVGAGRVMAFAGDSTYRWAMQGYRDAHLRFWRQIVLWLARMDESAEGNVWVRLDSRRFRPGSRVEFTVGAGLPTGEPVGEAHFTAAVVTPDGRRRPVRLWRRGDVWTGSFPETTSPGDYAIEVKAQTDGQPFGEARARFLVFVEELELDNPAADPALLANLAAMTKDLGGEALAPEQFNDLLTRLRERAARREISVQAKQTLWDRWPFMLLLVGLLSGEWYLRKRWGLV